MPETKSESKTGNSKTDTVLAKAATAVCTLAFGAALLVLPPVANHQLAGAEKTLQKPVIAVILAVLAIAVSAWVPRLAIAVALTIAVASMTNITYYIVTTQPGRSAASTSRNWQEVPLASGASGIAENTPDVFGAARLDWSGDTVRLDLHSETGTTQQGFYLNGGSATSSYYFTATVVKVDGGPAVTCPLLFGITNNRQYYTFRIQDDSGADDVVSYEIVPNSPALTSGFHGVLEDGPLELPYVDHWNIVHPSERNRTKLAMLVTGNYYRFYVDDREVFSRQIDDVPSHTVSFGVTVLANNLKSDAVCNYTNVRLRVEQ